MLILLRILFGAALVYEMVQGAKAAPSTIGKAGDLTEAFYVAVCVGLGILNALVWAPALGSAVSGPLTGMITESTYVERINWILRLARWLENRGYRRLAVWICFWEGIRHPKAPAAFVIGFKNARRGSWFEKVFAREVFRLQNIQNCVQAYLALKRRGIDPRPHPSQEINIVLLSLEKPPRPEPAIVPVPVAPRVSALKRDPRIRLFKRVEMNPGQAVPRTSAAPPSAPLRTEPAWDPVTDQPTAAAPEDHGRWFSSVWSRLAAFLRTQ
jgi:hypothetical protein